MLTINRLPTFIRQVVNDARQNRPQIKIHPVDDSGDVSTAKILDGLIRNIEYASDADVAYDRAIEAAVSMGCGYVRITTDWSHDDSFDMDIRIESVPDPFRVYGDPNSEAADSSDWMSAFVLENLTHDEFEAKYKGADPVDWESDYKPLSSEWYSSEGEGSVTVAEYWRREEIERTVVQLSTGEIIDAEEVENHADIFQAAGATIVNERPVKSWRVTQYIMTGAEVLKTTNWPGRYIPIVPVYGDEVNVEGKRHFRSLIRDAKDPQRMFNYWRTTATELVALAPKAPWIGKKGTFRTDASKWATANVANHAFIEYDGDIPPSRMPFDGPPAAALQEAANASDDMKSVMGLYDASLGAQSNETSGRAILARQREGDVSTFHFQDNLTRAIRHIGRIVVDLIPHVYTGPRIVRVIGEDKTQQAVQVNQPNPVTGAIYDLTTGRYDVTVEAGPSFTTRREEAANQMMELLRSFPQAAPYIGDLMARNLDWPGADEIAERLKMLVPQGGGQDPQVQALQQQVQQMAETFKQLTDMRAIESAKVDVQQYKAETDRAKVAAAGMTPDEIRGVVMSVLRDLGLPNQAQIGLPSPAPIAPPNLGQPGMPPAMPMNVTNRME